MAKRFLTQYDIGVAVREWDISDVPRKDLRSVLETNKSGELLRTGHADRSELNARNNRAIAIREIANGTTKSRTEIYDLSALSDLCFARQFIRCRRPAEMILIVLP